MADNVPITPGSGATIATDDVGGVQYQRIKVDLGGDGLASPLVRGQQSAANSMPVALAADQADFSVGDYETVAASQTAQVLGTSGAAGDYLAGLLIVPASTSPGNVLILDNATSITVFAGGAGSVSNLVPFFVPLGIKSASGAWKVTTGANVSVIACGNFA